MSRLIAKFRAIVAAERANVEALRRATAEVTVKGLVFA